MDSNGNLFFVLMNPIALACWDSSLPYAVENIKIVAQNDETLQFASGVKVIKNLFGQDELWVITNRFQVHKTHQTLQKNISFFTLHSQKIAAGTLNTNEINFRIQSRNINELLRGNPKCNGQQLNANFLFPST